MTEYVSFFKTVKGNEGSLCKYPTRLDTYGRGCEHNCHYCYARSLLDFRGMWRPEAPAIADIDKIRRKIDRLHPGDIIRLGGMTDCFQPIEARHKVTKATIAMLNRKRVGYLIVTKSHLVATDEYLRMLDPELAHVQISVTNTDDAAALEYERCSLTSKRLDALQKLQDAHIDVELRLSPYVHEFIDSNVLRSYCPQKILVEFLRVNHWIERWLGDRIDLSYYTLKHGGYRHLPLDLKRSYLGKLRDAMPDAEFSVCEDVPEHWEYWRENENANKEDCCNLRKGVPLCLQGE